MLSGVDISMFQVGIGDRARRAVMADDVSVSGQAEAVVKRLCRDLRKTTIKKPTIL